MSRVKRIWTPDEDQRLTDMWGQVDAHEVCASLGRTWSAIIKHAAELGLPTGLPEGLVTLMHASRVLGHDRGALLRIAARNGVPVRRHPCPLSKRLGGETPRWRCVDLDALRAAVEREDRETETVHAAALRRGIPDETLRLWLRKEKVIPAREGPRVVHRVATVDIDRVVQARRPSVPTLEMTGAAARRVGVNVSTLQLWLRKAGLRKATPHGRIPWLDPAVVDAVVARHRAASAGRTRSEGDDDVG